MCSQLNLTQANAAFIKNHYSEQVAALQALSPIIDEAIHNGMPPNTLIFGGGTALAMYYLRHRLSFDIDLFVNDIQYLNFFSPKLWIDENTDFKDDYIHLAHHIRFSTTNNIRVDILHSSFYSEPLLDDSQYIFKRDIYISQVQDIIANKVIFRKADNKPRDILDIAVCLQKYPNIIKNLLDTNAISKNDLMELKNALNQLDKNIYNQNISILSPFDEFKQTAINAPTIIKQHIETLF